MAGTTPEETDRLINEAISTGNAEAAAQLYEPDGVWFSQGSRKQEGGRRSGWPLPSSSEQSPH